MYTRRVARGAKTYNLICNETSETAKQRQKSFAVYDFRNVIDAEGTE